MKLLTVSKNVFSLFCLIAAILFCGELATKYSLNESSTQVSVKKLSISPKQTHPAITVCLFAKKGRIYLNLPYEDYHLYPEREIKKHQEKNQTSKSKDNQTRHPQSKDNQEQRPESRNDQTQKNRPKDNHSQGQQPKANQAQPHQSKGNHAQSQQSKDNRAQGQPSKADKFQLPQSNRIDCQNLPSSDNRAQDQQSMVNLTQIRYYCLAVGERNDTGGILEGHLVNLDNLDTFGQLENVLKPMHYYINAFEELYENEDQPRQTQGSSIPLFNSYLDPNGQCATFESISGSAGALQEVVFDFNASKLQQLHGSGTNMVRFYLHSPRQFIRGSGQTEYHAFKVADLGDIHTYIKQSNWVTIQIDHIKVLTSRWDKNGRCNKSLENYDAYWMETVTKLVGCVPTYWKNLYHQQKLPDCKSSSQLKEISEYHMSPPDKYRGRINSEKQKALRRNKQVFKMHELPCKQMHITTSLLKTMHHIGRRMEDKYFVSIKFATDEYKDAQNVRTYDAKTLFAEMSGYLGIFIGVSILQGVMRVVHLAKWAHNKWQY